MDALRGIGLILRTPRLRRLCAFPLGIALIAYLALGIGGAAFALDWLANLLATKVNAGAFAGFDALVGLGRGLVVVLWLFLFPFLFTALAGILFPWFFDRLSLAVEETVAPGEQIPNTPPALGVSLKDSFFRLLLNLTLTIAALIASFTLPLGPIPVALATGLIGLMDFTAPAFLRRQITLGRQFRTLVPGDGGTFSFFLAAAVLPLIPLVGVFFLPALAAGGTLIARRRAGDSR